MVTLTCIVINTLTYIVTSRNILNNYWCTYIVKYLQNLWLSALSFLPEILQILNENLSKSDLHSTYTRLNGGNGLYIRIFLLREQQKGGKKLDFSLYLKLHPRPSQQNRFEVPCRTSKRRQLLGKRIKLNLINHRLPRRLKPERRQKDTTSTYWRKNGRNRVTTRLINFITQ